MELKKQLATIKSWANSWIYTTKQKKNTTPLVPITTKDAKLNKTKCEE
jgi:hypothetical protein